ncbi:hypothetical protein [Actinobaculum sp. 352]|uniref:hypothetical protein n=1 Tax=Actinobaculum sp. 352 TaxID=2490946 RepID=UPI000F7E4D1A|nr:hypothetical protein [Actinobaculum sp. 352]RTE47902.1 hypothetical protein EKN07_11625 [Actinobaculum sp. 352]
MGNETNRLATAAEKRRRALELRRAGWNYRDIAQEIGYKSVASAHKAVRTELANIPKEEADALRTLELDRLDDLQAATYDLASRGDPAAVNTALRIMDHRARLLGLYERVETDDSTQKMREALTGFLTSVKEVVDGYDETEPADETIPETSTGTSEE